MVLLVMFTVSCATQQPATDVHYKGADPATGAAIDIGKDVRIISFDGEPISGWQGSSLTGNKTVFVPAGAHKFVVQRGFVTKEYEENFVAGHKYFLFGTIGNSTGITFTDK